MGKRSLLIYAHYYAPDIASTGQILKELAEGMLDQFNILVICAVPSYEGKIKNDYKTQRFYHETINGVDVIRIRVPEFSKADKISRVKNIIAYFFGAMRATIMAGSRDYIFSISQPPILGGILGVYGKWLNRLKGCPTKFIYNIQDFNPEQIMVTGYSRNKLLINTLMALDKFSCRKSDLIITVGSDLGMTVRERFRGRQVPKTKVINNWVDEDSIYPIVQEDKNIVSFKETYRLDKRFVIMYSGNIGLYYDLENIIRVIKKFEPGSKTPDGREVVFAFVGSGGVLEELQSYVREHRMENVRFIPYQEKNNLIYSLNAADVHWVVNAKGIKGISCPSKYYGVASVSKPVLAVLEKGTEIRQIIEDTKSGLCAEPGDYKKIEENINWFIKNAGGEELSSMGKRGRDNLLQNFTKDISIKKYMKAILSL